MLCSSWTYLAWSLAKPLVLVGYPPGEADINRYLTVICFCTTHHWGLRERGEPLSFLCFRLNCSSTHLPFYCTASTMSSSGDDQPAHKPPTARPAHSQVFSPAPSHGHQTWSSWRVTPTRKSPLACILRVHLLLNISLTWLRLSIHKNNCLSHHHPQFVVLPPFSLLS